MRQRVELVLIVFFASGFSGLIYESVWSHYVKLFLGHAAYAQTLVLTVFIGGLAGGSWLCARMAERIRNPLRVYAIVEASIGALALVFHGVFVATTDWAFASLLPATCDQSNTFCLSQWLLAAAMLLPQSLLLGATFPLVSSAVLRWSTEHPGNDIASLYFLNSLGAVLGVLTSAFLLIPGVGLPGTLLTAGLINICIALAAYALSRNAPEALVVTRFETPAGGQARSERSLVLALLATALLTGLSSFIYEIAWIRMLSLVLGASTHSFELMLASFILGLALGGMWVRHRVDHSADPVRLLAYVQLFMGLAAAATIPVYNGAFDLMAWTLSSVSRNAPGFVLFNIASTLIAMLVMLPATFCAGMTLPLITYRLLRSSAGEKALGMVYSVNTLGAIFGIALAVHFLLTGLGVRGALIVGCVIDVALGVFLLVAWRSSPGARRSLPWRAVAAVAGLAALTLAFDIDPRRSSSGVFRSGIARISPSDEVIYHRDGKTATVDVIQSSGGRRSIRTNGKTDAALSLTKEHQPSADEYTMTLLALLPLGHRPDAASAAVIGFGSGMSTSVLLSSPHLTRVDTIEIEPAMIEGAQKFRPVVEAAFADPRSHIVIDDAKSYFARGRNRYDIVISEPSNPWVSGVASLFTEEFYRRVSTYMNDGAVLAQWLHTYEMDATTLASILEALSRTFPEYVVYSSIDLDIVVIARKGGPPGEFQERVLDFPRAQPVLERLLLKDPRVIRRRVIAGARTLRPMFQSYGVGANSDYFPLVDQRASASRFMRSKVTELTELQASPVPMLEMVDGGTHPADSPTVDNPTVNQADFAAKAAWGIHDVLSGGRAQGADVPISGGGEMAAQMVRYWMSDCRSGLTFAQIAPSLIAAGDATTPYLPAPAASAMWRRVGESPCARALEEKQRRQLDLIGAVAGRDPMAMIKLSLPILDDAVGKKSEMSELALLAATTAFACLGRPADARVLLDRASRDWVRPEMRQAELRYLRAVTDPAHPAAVGGCISPAARAPAAPAARSTGR
ncbi:MAG: fused MFS/spermidine synthase [Usitatibacter sp.]